MLIQSTFSFQNRLVVVALLSKTEHQKTHRVDETISSHFTFLSLICSTTSCMVVIGFHLLLNSLDAFNIRDETLFVYTKIGLVDFLHQPYKL